MLAQLTEMVPALGDLAAARLSTRLNLPRNEFPVVSVFIMRRFFSLSLSDPPLLSSPCLMSLRLYADMLLSLFYAFCCCLRARVPGTSAGR